MLKLIYKSINQRNNKMMIVSRKLNS